MTCKALFAADVLAGRVSAPYADVLAECFARCVLIDDHDLAVAVLAEPDISDAFGCGADPRPPRTRSVQPSARRESEHEPSASAANPHWNARLDGLLGELAIGAPALGTPLDGG